MRKTVARNDARQAIVELAVVQLCERGPVGVHPKDICEELGLSKALVNYHFGGRDGLIGEAMAVGYERYVETLEQAAAAAGPEPLDKLLAWVDRQVDWTVENAGLASALNFPHFAPEMPSEIDESVLARINDAGVRNFANLQRLVLDSRNAVPGADQSPAAVALDAALIGWLTLGASVWNAGKHLPTQRLPARREFNRAREHMRHQVRLIVSGTTSASRP